MADFEKEIATADKIPDAERKALIDQEAFLPSYRWNVNDWLCAQHDPRLRMRYSAPMQTTAP